MNLTRRELLLAGLGLFIAGCTENTGLVDTYRPRIDWPSDANSDYIPAPGTIFTPLPQPRVPPASPIAPEPPVALGELKVIPRSAWATAGPILSRINPMNGVNRITCHHEGWIPVYFTDTYTTRQRLESIRRCHVGERLHAGDIGYHFIIDRAGRLWEGRSLKYQGAHVKHENEHNVGVMALGNFEEQTPTYAQVTTLRHTVATLMCRYHVPVSRVYTHQELNRTLCPGIHLQPRIAAMRANGEFLA